MYDVSELANLSVLVLVVHVGEVSVLRAHGEGVITTSYEVHSSSSVTASLQGSAGAPCEFESSERLCPRTSWKELHPSSTTNGAIGNYKI